jgi:hypothetical protein
MSHIVLTDEQLRTYHEAETDVEIRDEAGRILGRIEPDFRPETRDEARIRMRVRGPGLPGSSTQSMLRALEAEWKRTGGFDQEYAQAFVIKWRAERSAERDDCDE